MLTFGASLDPNYTGTDGLIMISKMCRDRAKFHVLDDERDRLLAPTQFPVDYRVTQKIEF